MSETVFESETKPKTSTLPITHIFLAAAVGLLLGLSVFFQHMVAIFLEGIFNHPIQNSYPILTYLIFFVLATPASVFLNRYFNLYKSVEFDGILRVGILTNAFYLLPPFLALVFSVLQGSSSLGTAIALTLAGTIAFFGVAALNAVVIEKILKRKNYDH